MTYFDQPTHALIACAVITVLLAAFLFAIRWDTRNHRHMTPPRVPPLPNHWTAPTQPDNRTYVRDETR